ncbi:hypothetical protein IMY05_C3887000200 [Salix suchowensis]|nr:hypothetical protein IMY05_C3887000200 [Salix suchowensis]
MAGVERSAKMERTQKMLLILAFSYWFLPPIRPTSELSRRLWYQWWLYPSPNGPVFQLGPTVYCSYPGVGCVRILELVPLAPTLIKSLDCTF